MRQPARNHDQSEQTDLPPTDETPDDRPAAELLAKPKRRKSVPWKRIIIFWSFLVITTGVLVVFLSDIFKINAINVSLQNVVCADTNSVTESSRLHNKLIFFVDPVKVQARLKSQLVCLDSVTVELQPPRAVAISMTGKNAVMVLTELPKVPLNQARVDLLHQIEATHSASVSALIKESTGSATLFTKADFRIDENQIGKKYLVDSVGNLFAFATQYSIPEVAATIGELQLGNQISPSIVKSSLAIVESLQQEGYHIIASKLWGERSLLVTTDNPTKITPKGPNELRLAFYLDEHPKRQTTALQLVVKQAKIDANQITGIDLRFSKPVIEYAPK